MIACLVRPTWIVAWDGDYSTMQPFCQLLRKFPDLPGMQHSIRSAEAPCP
jgi:hypothetical protein